MNNLRESFLRLLLFLLCVVVISISFGMLLSKMQIPAHYLKPVAYIATTVSAIGSYLMSFKPGWLYNSLQEMSKGEQ